MSRAVAWLSVVGLLLFGTANAAADQPRSYRGTIVVEQAPVPGSLPTGESSLSYSFRARYSVSGRRRKPFGVQRGGVYSVAGSGNQTLAFRARLHRAFTSQTEDHVIDWHGSGRWTRRSGQVAYVNLFGRRFSAVVDLGLKPTIPLSVSSEATYVSTTEEGTTCVTRGGLDGSRVWVEAPCESRSQSVTIPVRTRIAPYALLSEDDPRFRTCAGPRTSVRVFNGFCGRTKPGGRIRATHTTVWEHPADVPFSPWADEGAAQDAQANAGLFHLSSGTFAFGIRTTYKFDLKPVR